MMEVAEKSAKTFAEPILGRRSIKLKHYYESEISRLRNLQKKNKNHGVEEVELMEESYSFLKGALPTARLRQDALRLIWKGSEKLFGWLKKLLKFFEFVSLNLQSHFDEIRVAFYPKKVKLIE